MQTNELPAAWASTKVGDICNLLNGRAYKKDELLENGKYRVLRVGNLFTNPHWFYSDLDLEDNKYCDKGDLLYAWSASFGPYIWDGNKVIYHYHIWKVEFPEELISKKFLRAYFDWDKEVIKREQGSGTTMIHVTKKSMEERSIPLPPLNEQHRIADKLDTTLAAIEACKQKLNNAAETIKRFRQSVLAAAVSGELTREWREERGIDEEWEQIELGDMLEDIRYGTAQKCSYDQKEDSTPVIRIPNIKNQLISHEDLKYTKLPTQDLGKLALRKGDLLCIRSNGSPDLVGQVAIAKEADEGLTFAGYLIRIRLKENILLPEYLAILMQAPLTRAKIELAARSTSGVHNINSRFLSSLVFKIPTIDEQKEVITLADTCLESQQKLMISHASAQRSLVRLSSSILAKAFRGELVPQDPNDEPASVLLERIKAQREAEAAAKKPAKRGRKKKADAAQLVIPEGIADNHLAKVLEECGALSERALLAASELEPGVFQRQLAKELVAGGLKQVDVDGEAAYADAAWEGER